MAGPIQAAAGYPQYSGTGLMMPVLSSHMLVNFYERTIFGEISETSYTGELSRGGDTIYFRKEPQFLVRDGAGLGATIRHDHAQFDTVAYTIGRSMYYSLGVDPLQNRLVSDWKALESQLITSGSRQMAEYVDRTILNEMYLYADANNIGTRAGRITKSYNLGKPGTPLNLTSANILETLTRIKGVMAEQNIDISNEDMYLIVPPSIDVMLMNSELKAAYFSGMGTTTYLNGKVPNKLANLTMFTSNRTPLVYDAVAAKWCYILMFGVKKATAFASIIDFMRTTDNDPHTWMYFIQHRQAWDFFVLYPNLIGYIYASVF